MIAILINMLAAFVLVYAGSFIANFRTQSKTLHKLLIPSVLLISFIQAALYYVPIGINLDFFLFVIIYFSVGFLAFNTNHLKINFKIWFGFMFLASLFYLVFSTKYFQAENMGTRMEVERYTQDFNLQDFYYNASEGDVRRIPYDTAISLAQKSLSESATDDEDVRLGKVLEINHEATSIQIINKQEYWVVPLKYTGSWFEILIKQIRFGGVNAYILVNAENQNTSPRVVISEADTERSFIMEKSLGGILHRNLVRDFHSNYPMDKIRKFKLVIDDNYMPYMAAYTVKAHTGVDVYVPDSVILFDFNKEKYSKYPVGQTPKWIEIDVDLETTMEMVNDWGELRKGYWSELFNTFASELTDYQSGHGKDMLFVSTANGYAWASGMTSINKTNDSIVDLVFVDTKTGKAKIIKSNGADENGIIAAVQSKLGVNSQKWQALMPIKYLIANKYDVWILPVIDKNTYLLQKIAIVDGQVLNKISVADNLELAINGFLKLEGYEQQLLNSKEVEKLDGIIETFNMVGLNDTVYSYIKLAENDIVIECNTNNVRKCLILKEGNFVEFEVFEKNKDIKSVTKVINFE